MFFSPFGMPFWGYGLGWRRHPFMGAWRRGFHRGFHRGFSNRRFW